jgi:hypothetical protein
MRMASKSDVSEPRSWKLGLMYFPFAEKLSALSFQLSVAIS